jgi:hypothetical protein
MSVQLLDSKLEGTQFPEFSADQPSYGNGLAFPPLPIAGGGDGITRLLPPTFGDPFSPGESPTPQYGSSYGSAAFGQLGLLLQQLGSLLQQLMGSIGNAFGGGGFGNCSGDQYFQNANGGSVGDPHLSFNGNTWNSMQSQPDLLDSNSFSGGYQISTQATAPNAHGVTYNESASISSGYGLTSVTLDTSGAVTITQDGSNLAIAPGQTLQLGNGESVTQNQNGSLLVSDSNGFGGSITTTLSLNGNGVDVQTSASNVDLGGALVTGSNTGQPASPSEPRPIYRRYGQNAEQP